MIDRDWSFERSKLEPLLLKLPELPWCRLGNWICHEENGHQFQVADFSSWDGRTEAGDYVVLAANNYLPALDRIADLERENADLQLRLNRSVSPGVPGAALKLERRNAGVQAVDLAIEMGTTKQHIWKIESYSSVTRKKASQYRAALKSMARKRAAAFTGRQNAEGASP